MAGIPPKPAPKPRNIKIMKVITVPGFIFFMKPSQNVSFSATVCEYKFSKHVNVPQEHQPEVEPTIAKYCDYSG